MGRIFANAIKSAVLATAGILSAASAAKASFSPIGPSAIPSEANIGQIFSHAYGGTFTASGANYSNGSITATRIADDGAGGAAQASFTGVLESADVIGKFAKSNQAFGYTSPDGVYHPLFSVTGNNFAISGSYTGPLKLTDADFTRTGTGITFYADTSENIDGMDHMIEYKLSGAGITGNKYVLAFEDQCKCTGSDFDYNDMVVQINTAPAAVPLPAAGWMGLATLVGAGAAGRLKRASLA